jgi:hypothetical protein
MEWFKIKSDATTHWKQRSLTDRGIWAWVHCMTLAARYETDGVLPRKILETEPRWEDILEEAPNLVRVELWEPHEDGWLIHDWADHNTTREAIETKRSSSAERVRRHRARRKNHTSGPTHHDGNALHVTNVTPDVTPVTRVTCNSVTPLELEEELELKEQDLKHLSPADAFAPPSDPHTPPATKAKPEPKPDPHTGFTEFWDTYPRKSGKAKALKAWPTAVKKVKGNHQTITEAARCFRDDPNRVDQYTPHASTWLNQERWNDPPLPGPTRHPRPTRAAPTRAQGFLDLAQQIHQTQPVFELEGNTS